MLQPEEERAGQIFLPGNPASLHTASPPCCPAHCPVPPRPFLCLPSSYSTALTDNTDLDFSHKGPDSCVVQLPCVFRIKEDSVLQRLHSKKYPVNKQVPICRLRSVICSLGMSMAVWTDPPVLSVYAFLCLWAYTHTHACVYMEVGTLSPLITYAHAITYRLFIFPDLQCLH